MNKASCRTSSGFLMHAPHLSWRGRYIKKTTVLKSGRWFVILFLIVLAQANCFRRTCICTSTTFCTSVWVDRILITFRDCANWTFIDTSTASDTIVTNYVSHFLNYLIISTNLLEQRYIFFSLNCNPRLVKLTNLYLI